MNRPQIEKCVLDWIAEPRWQHDAKRFEHLALALFAFQYDSCAPYARYCDALERTPDTVETLTAIPAVPTGAFKEFDLRCFAPDRTVKTFRTSGTSLERRGQLHLDTLAIYEASLLASLRHAFLGELAGRAPSMHFLAPDADSAPHSSLTHMFEVLRRAEGSASSRFDWTQNALDIERLRSATQEAHARSEPLIVAGTSFAFVHLLDAPKTSADGKDALALPPGSRVMETGGFKGRSREVPREELRRAIAQCFEVPEQNVVNQYGMTELGSQFYDSTLIDPHGPRRKLVPPWTCVRFIDPESEQDVAPGEVGMIVLHDLTNTGSVAAIQTADLGRAILDDEGRMTGFDVLGREAGAEARGCSIAADAMLEAAGGGDAT